MDQSSDKIRLNDIVDACIKSMGMEATMQQYDTIRSQYYAQYCYNVPCEPDPLSKPKEETE